MRIQSVLEANTQQQSNPFFVQNADSIADGKSASLISFKECLRSQIQDVKAPATTRKAELAAVSYLCNYLAPQRVSPRHDLKQKAREYVPLSKL